MSSNSSAAWRNSNAHDPPISMSAGEPIRLVDVIVIGDGPAGSALAAACARRGVDVVLVGPDLGWEQTYGTWVDDLTEVEGLPDVAAVLGITIESIAVHTDRSRELRRPYGLFDNEALRSAVRSNVEHLCGRVDDVMSAPDRSTRHRVHVALTASGGTASGEAIEFRARLVVDTAGWPSSFAHRSRTTAPAWQTAMGVVLAEPPDGDLGRATWMDFRAVGVGAASARRSSIGPRGVTTFCYSLPVRDGWMVEETVLAARPAVEPIALLPRLAARLGRHPDDVLAEAVRTEYVRIPMGGARPDDDQPVVAFGAAAGYVHPATGFSVTASLRAAPRVADAVVEALSATSSSAAADSSRVSDAVWTAAMRRTRVLHDYGLEVLLRQEDDDVRAFFGEFFDLPVEQWSSYLRIDTPPGELAAVMMRLFSASSWSMRRRLMSGNPLAFARLLRP
jgi:lycopene cyclase-like protein